MATLKASLTKPCQISGAVIRESAYLPPPPALPVSRRPCSSTLIEIFNLVTPNGDGLNDFFEIRGVENFPNTFVRIYNRWGVLVFETENYENNAASDRVFKGFSKGRITIQQNKRLPVGTYYYIVNFRGENPGKSSYSGYLYLNN